MLKNGDTKSERLNQNQTAVRFLSDNLVISEKCINFANIKEDYDTDI